MKLVAVILVAFYENMLIVKKNRDIVCSGQSFLGISVVSSYTEKWQPG